MRTIPRPLALSSVPLLAFLATWQGDELALVSLASDERPAELRFEVTERGRGPIPARLTFVPPEGGAPLLFPNTGAAPKELAVRDNVVYSRRGSGLISVPPGRYTVYASRGLEWSLYSEELDLAPGERTSFRAELEHELDTSGWIGADFHLHTLTHSGHGDATMEERVLSFLGEGLELAVATDHNHNTDYRPTMAALEIEGAFATLTGNEVSTPIGHFNAFPLDPQRAPVDPDQSDANTLFALLREETNAWGVLPLIQLNHPRLQGIDYFARTGLDPVFGTSTNPAYSRDFDAIEVLNENRSLGYHDPVTDGRDTHGHLHSVLRDWFHLLNLGERYAALGNSDSHQVRAIVAGYPRNYVRSSSDDPAHIQPTEIVAAVRAKQTFTTTGPFVEFWVGDTPMGGDARAHEGHATLRVSVRAASWVACDRLKVFVNGDLSTTRPISATRETLRLEEELELCLLGTCARHGRERAHGPGARDAWIAVVVEGDEPLTPLLGGESMPMALSNPIWVDGDGDGQWTSPSQRIEDEVRAQPTPAIALEWYAELSTEEQALALARVPRGPFAAVLVEAGFDSPQRNVRLAASRAAERHVLSGALPAVQRSWKKDDSDPFLDALLLRMIILGRPDQGIQSLQGYETRHGKAALRDYSDEILSVFPSCRTSAWQVLGPQAVPPGSPADRQAPGPKDRATGPRGQALDWTELPSTAGEYVDLVGLGGESTDHSLAYAQTFLHSSRARRVLCCFGSDDGGRLWCNEELLYANPDRKSAHPFEKLLTLELRPGWNRVLLEVENATGGFGFYCLFLEPELEVSATPR